MKNLILLLIPIIALNFLFAEDANMQVGAQVNINTYLGFMDDNDNGGILSPGIEGFFDYKFSKKLAMNLSLGYNQIKIDYPTVLTNNMINLTLKGKYFIFNSKNFSPFIDLGAGVFSFSQENGYFSGNQTTTLLTGGVGVEIPISNKFNLIPSLNYSITQDDLDDLPNYEYWLDDEYITASVGISYKFGGAKEEAVVPEPIAIEKPAEPVEEVVVEEPVEEVVVETPIPVVVEEVAEETEAVDEVVEEVEFITHYEKMQYMIKKGDNLCHIAGMAYNDKSMWKEIYKWNQELIGSNPNLIYPYYELTLKNVPAENISELTYSFYDYKVQPNESLSSIAARKYGNSYAWVIILRDNEDILGDKYTTPKVGTVLKLRDKVFNK